jgi:hypothetical protein
MNDDDDDDECGSVGRMKISREIKVPGENLPLCPPEIPHDPIWARTRDAAVGSQ